MAANDIRAGGAFVELFVKGNVGPELDKLGKKLKEVGKSVTDIGKRMGALGAAILAPLAGASLAFASMGDAITKASQRTGIGAEALQGLKYAAEQSGASFEDLESGIRKMSKAVFEAAAGSATAKESFRSIGLSVEELKGLSPDEQFLKIADALNRVTDPAAKASIAMEIFGKGGAKLLPLMDGGAAAIRELSKRAEELGLIFSAESAQAATKFGDTLSDLHKQLSAVIFQVGSAVAGALQPFADAAINCMKSVISWVKENKKLVVGLLIAGTTFVAVGTALIGVGLAINVVGSALTGIKTAFAAVSSILGLVLNPIVLIGAGLIALAAYFKFGAETGAVVVNYLKGKFEELAATAQETFGGIADALSAGDISLAAKILWTGLQVAWAEGSAELSAKWADFRAMFVKVAVAAFYGAQEIWTNVKANLAQSFANLTAGLGSLWDGFIGTFTNAWDAAVTLVAKGINYIRGAFDSSFDAKAANKMADNILAANENARQAAEVAKQKQREQDKSNEIAAIENERKRKLKEISDKEMGLSGAADQNAKDEVAALEKRKADLQAQLTDLRSKAKTEKDNKPEDKLKLPEKPLDLDAVLANKGAVDTKAAGTFNAAAVPLLGGNQKWAEKTAENTAKAARELEKLNRKEAVYK